jgi:tetratricopeptide (TPR) repeat protein
METTTVTLPVLAEGRVSPQPAREHPRLRRILDVLLIGAVLSFAFLVASFAARNSDLWLHLAGGRLLAQGRYQFGVDPFAYTTEGVYWTNHAWLFDLFLYLSYSWLGGAALVVLKALLITLLAALMLSLRRPHSRMGIPAFCTLLALLAMSPRLLLHSTCLSYVFLGLSLWLLWRPRTGGTSFREDLKRHGALLLLFVLWVNVDSWFLLGPLLAALFWLGERLSPRNVGGDSPPTPAWLWLAGLAMCLINPHFWHAFALPADLAALPAALRHDPRFASLFVSPWQQGWPYRSGTGLNLAASAYFALVALGLLSFLVNVRHLHGWRLLVWLTFAGLAAWLARAVPFFAVVAGPITALNWQDFLSRRTKADASESLFGMLGRVGVFLAALGLLFLAWPGWLQGVRGEGRRVDWAVKPDSSLRRAAETLDRWHEQKLLSDEDRGFAFHPQLVPYCAWFCPKEKGFLDHRFPLFGTTAGEFAEICQALNPALSSERNQPTDWKALFHKHGITHLILYDPDPSLLLPALRRLTVQDRNWRLLHVDGQAVIFGWKDGERVLPSDVPPFDAERLAFAPTKTDEWTLPAAPESGPSRGPRAAGFWSHFGSPIEPPSWQTQTASVLIRYFEDSAPRQVQKRNARRIAWTASLVGMPALTASPLSGSIRLGTQLEQAPFALGDPVQLPPALPLLAIRAARLAVAKNPDDAFAYLRLGQAYLELRNVTAERSILRTFSPLERLRNAQIASALENAVRRNPDLQPAHQALFELYFEHGFRDAALDHLREVLRLARAAGPVSGETAEVFDKRIRQMEESTRGLEREVRDSINDFIFQAQKMSAEPLPKARLALSMGLARRALEDVLMQSQMVLLGGEGLRLQVDLQLMLGRDENVALQLGDPDWKENKRNLGYVDLPAFTATGPAVSPYHFPAYDWLLFCHSAARGDYDEAADALQTLLDQMLEPRSLELLKASRLALAPAVASEVGWSFQLQPWLTRLESRRARLFQTDLLKRVSFMVVEQADLHVLAGILALERGRPNDAEKSFSKALELSRLASRTADTIGGQPLAKEYLRIIRSARR